MVTEPSNPGWRVLPGYSTTSAPVNGKMTWEQSFEFRLGKLWLYVTNSHAHHKGEWVGHLSMPTHDSIPVKLDSKTAMDAQDEIVALKIKELQEGIAALKSVKTDCPTCGCSSEARKK